MHPEVLVAAQDMADDKLIMVDVDPHRLPVGDALGGDVRDQAPLEALDDLDEVLAARLHPEVLEAGMARTDRPTTVRSRRPRLLG